MSLDEGLLFLVVGDNCLLNVNCVLLLGIVVLNIVFLSFKQSFGAMPAAMAHYHQPQPRYRSVS